MTHREQKFLFASLLSISPNNFLYLEMIRAVIIDDVQQAIQTLSDDLKKYCPTIELIGTAGDVKSGITLIDKTKPDVVFLDIHLKNDIGFSILEKIKHTNLKVIFTTGSDQYAIKAIKYSALDYLLKPVDSDDLINAVKKITVQTPQESIQHLSLLLENLKTTNNSAKRIVLNSADRIHVVNISDIIRCESEGGYTLFFLQNKNQILVTKTLKEFEEMLDDTTFIRIHHSHLININYLKEYVKADGGTAIMTDNSQIPVSVRKKEHLMKMLKVD